MLSIREKVIGQDIQEGGMQMTGEVQPTLETKNQIEERQTTIERIKDASLIEEVSQDITLTVTYCYSCYQSGKFQFMIFSPVEQVSGATEKTNESENMKEKIIKEESCTLEIQVKLTSNEMVIKASLSLIVINVNYYSKYFSLVALFSSVTIIYLLCYL